MPSRLRTARRILSVCLLLGVVGVLVWLGSWPATDGPGPAAADGGSTDASPDRVWRLGLIPERNIFEQRERYQALAGYLSRHIGRPIELVTLNTYLGVLDEFGDGHIDAAFLGSMVATLAHDRLGARVILKPVTPDGVSTYRGVLFVRDDSPIRGVADLAGHSLGMVRTTTAGNLFPVCELAELGLLHGDARPTFRWLGTHDDVIQEVVGGQVDAGAAKDLRLAAYEAEHPEVKLRRLAVGEAVPNNALLVRAGSDPLLVDRLREALLTMHQTAEGASVLEKFGAARFVPCSIDEYRAVYDMAETLGPDWPEAGVDGPAPRRPAERQPAAGRED